MTDTIMNGHLNTVSSPEIGMLYCVKVPVGAFNKEKVKVFWTDISISGGERVVKLHRFHCVKVPVSRCFQLGEGPFYKYCIFCEISLPPSLCECHGVTESRPGHAPAKLMPSAACLVSTAADVTLFVK